MYKWQQIRSMKKQGLGIKKICRILKLSRNTVRKYLLSGEPPRFHKKPVVKKITPFVDEVRKMMHQGYLGTRIYREIKVLGFSGSVSLVWRCVQRMKREGAKKKLSTTRVETAPGEQMQYDWKEWKLFMGGVLVKIYLHAVVLSFSRKKFYLASLSITEQDIIRAIESAFFYFGGMARELVIDNPKQMVMAHRKDGVICFNDAFLKFCGLYGIHPNPCRPYWPRTKGKVERPFFFLQEQLLRGLKVDRMEDLEEKLRAFTQAYNEQVHSALGESPEVRFFREEKAALLSIPHVEPVLLYPREFRRISNDGYLRYRGGYYPVSMDLCLEEVWVEAVLGRTVRLYAKDETLLCEFPRHCPEDGRRPIHPEHEVMNQQYREKRSRAAASVNRQFVTLFGETGERYAAGLRDKVGANYRWHLHEIMSYCLLYAPEEVRAVMDTCIEIGVYHKNSVLRFLDPKKLKVPEISGVEVILPKTDLTRDLSAYAGLDETVSHA